MKKEYIEKAAKAEVENIVFYNICSEEIDNEESNYEAGRRDGVCDFGEELFIAGANWRINSVWHNVNIEPSEKRVLIVIESDGHISQSNFMVGVDKWKDFVKDADIIKWCYKEDLIPNTEE